MALKVVHDGSGPQSRQRIAAFAAHLPAGGGGLAQGT